MEHIDLKTLPTDHPLRNQPLGILKAQTRNHMMKRWVEVSTIKIGRATFNELASCWTDFGDFRVPSEQLTE